MSAMATMSLSSNVGRKVSIINDGYMCKYLTGFHRTRVLSETLGDIVNGFFDTISFKTMVRVSRGSMYKQ